MSTHCLIVEKRGKEYRAIYCRFDGGKAGDILKNYYNDPQKVSKLIDIGDILGLKYNGEVYLDYDNELCNEVFGPKSGKNMMEILKQLPVWEHIWIFKDGQWRDAAKHFVKGANKEFYTQSFYADPNDKDGYIKALQLKIKRLNSDVRGLKKAYKLLMAKSQRQRIRLKQYQNIK